MKGLNNISEIWLWLYWYFFDYTFDDGWLVGLVGCDDGCDDGRLVGCDDGCPVGCDDGLGVGAIYDDIINIRNELKKL